MTLSAEAEPLCTLLLFSSLNCFQIAQNFVFNFTNLDEYKHLGCKESFVLLNILRLLKIRLRRCIRLFEAILKQNKNDICNASSHLMVYMMQLSITSDFHEVKEKKNPVSLPFLLPTLIA